MGFHLCRLCSSAVRAGHRYPWTSSGDVTLRFEGGASWQMPDMILHYVADHGWHPPKEFVADVMLGVLAGGQRVQTRSWPKRVGYLSEAAILGESVPEGFVEKLAALMKQASDGGDRLQTKGVLR